MDSGSSTSLAGAGGGRDKLSSLSNATLGHILSFLPATEAARTATLSRRWRHVFAAVHTLTFGEAEGPFEMGYEYWRRCSSCGFNDESRAPRFVPGVTTALNGRHRGARAATAPLRALRVAFDEYGFRGGEDATKAVDGWLSYAVHGAGEALEIDLRLGTEPICRWPYALVSGGGGPRDAGERVVDDSRHDATNMGMHSDDAAHYSDDDDAAAYDDGGGDDSDEDDDDAAADDGDAGERVVFRHDATNMDMHYDDAADYSDDDDAADGDGDDDSDEDDDNAAADDGGSAATDDSSSSPAADYSEAAAAADASDDDDDDNERDPMVYVVPRSLFSSCAVLRLLRLSRCCIDLPSAIALPSLATLHLTRITGRRGGAIQRLVSACPNLMDLTLEACEDLTALALHGVRLRRLALRCCHQLTTVTVGTPELRAFEYRGDVPPASLLTMRAHAAPRRISFCAFDFCGVERGGELFDLTELLAGVERLHVTSARLGSCFVSYWGDSLCPCLPMLRNLEITGMLPDDDEFAVSTVARILERTPRLETLSLFFLPEPHPVKESMYHVVEKKVLDASHELRYDPHARLAAPPRDVVEIPSCLRETTKEINLVHYQGSVAQRAVAKFLLCNATVVDEVCWKVARGPLSIQMKLMEEVTGWVTNKSAKMKFF